MESGSRLTQAPLCDALQGNCWVESWVFLEPVDACRQPALGHFAITSAARALAQRRYHRQPANADSGRLENDDRSSLEIGEDLIEICEDDSGLARRICPPSRRRRITDGGVSPEAASS